jgi:hypothetical protein
LGFLGRQSIRPLNHHVHCGSLLRCYRLIVFVIEVAAEPLLPPAL